MQGPPIWSALHVHLTDSILLIQLPAPRERAWAGISSARISISLLGLSLIWGAAKPQETDHTGAALLAPATCAMRASLTSDG